MKKINLLFLLPFLLLTYHLAFSQDGTDNSFKKGTMVLDLKGELGLYNTVSVDKLNTTTNNTHNDRSGSKINNLGFEYGILNWLGVGIKLQRDNYFVSKDSTATSINTNGTLHYEYYTPSVKSAEFALTINAHPVRMKRFDLITGVNLGSSGFNMITNNPYHATVKGGGSLSDMHITTRFYFGKHFGLNLNLAYAGYNYKNLIIQDDNTPAKNAISLKGAGFNLGFGLQYKFKKFEKV